jgi:UDP-N-acetylmuramate: L-alanyl-gamma-D-glutamyl-meso-diaminopimelate ligase
MLAWILDFAGMNPGFLIGGIPSNFSVSAQFGKTPFFVVEADEYDTAFFDKRAKFVHYRPRTLIINNLEYDHADIYPDLAAIQWQFHQLLRCVPGNGLVISNAGSPAVAETLEMGCWTPVESFASQADATWQVQLDEPDQKLIILHDGEVQGRGDWGMIGRHNAENALAALLAARHAGVPMEQGLAALANFKGVKRRMEIRGTESGVTVYDDFAHHPTAIKESISGLRSRVGDARIVAILEPRSNTMKLGVHRDQLADSLSGADSVWLYQPADLGWDISSVANELGANTDICTSVETLVEKLSGDSKPGDHLLVMSNGGFGGIHQRLLDALTRKG